MVAVRGLCCRFFEAVVCDYNMQSRTQAMSSDFRLTVDIIREVVRVRVCETMLIRCLTLP